MGQSYPTSDSFHPPDKQPLPTCGRFEPRQGQLGPVDYRTVSPYTIGFVEVRHFPKHVELLQRGARSGSVGGDLQFMLETFPNHPRALRATAELFRRNGGRTPTYMTLGIQCWFDRAISYRQNDADVRMIFADDLIKNGRRKEALEQALVAESLVGESPRLNYNLGLLFFDVGDFERATLYAKKAYAFGFELPGLRNKLKKAGKWEP
jgi:tetratricopeptide (TPR) repeat protein